MQYITKLPQPKPGERAKGNPAPFSPRRMAVFKSAKALLSRLSERFGDKPDAPGSEPALPTAGRCKFLKIVSAAAAAALMSGAPALKADSSQKACEMDSGQNCKPTESARRKAPAQPLRETTPAKPKTPEPDAVGVNASRPRPALIGTSERMRNLRALLGRKEPKTHLRRWGRFEALMNAYADPELINEFREKHSELTATMDMIRDIAFRKNINNPLIRSGHMRLRKLEMQRRRALARRVHALEADITLYCELYDQLGYYAPNKACREDIPKARKKFGQDTHERLYNFASSSKCLRDDLRNMFGKKESDGIYKLILKSLGKKSPIRYISLGTGKGARARADELTRLLRDYPQFLLYPDAVFPASYSQGSKKGWGVGICSSEACKGLMKSREKGIMHILESSPIRTDSQNIDELLGIPPGRRNAPKRGAGSRRGRKNRRKPETKKELPAQKPTTTGSAIPGSKLKAGNWGSVRIDDVSPDNLHPAKKAKRNSPKKKGRKNNPPKAPVPAQKKKKKPIRLSSDPLQNLDLDAGAAPKKGQKRKKRKE